jgi:hypothetical protein
LAQKGLSAALYSARFDAGGGNTVPVNHQLRVTLTQAVGSIFELTWAVNAGGHFADASLGGVLHFELPAGYAVRSCQGYVAGDAEVATRPSTWGEVKSRYR